MTYILPSLVCFIDDALKRLSERHVENDLDMDVGSCTISEDAER